MLSIYVGLIIFWLSGVILGTGIGMVVGAHMLRQRLLQLAAVEKKKRISDLYGNRHE